MKKIVYLLILLLVSSCTSKTIYPKPKDLIPKDSMGMLLKDLFLANAARNIKNRNFQRKVNYHPLVYKKYGIDSTRFENSNFYYISQIDEYEDVLAKIILEIEEKQKVLTKRKKVRDSIRKDSLDKVRIERRKLPRNRIDPTLKE